MSWDARGNPRYCAGTAATLAATALLAGGCLVMSGMSAKAAEEASSNDARKEGKLVAENASSNGARKQGKLVQASPGASQVDHTADAFRPDPLYGEDYDAEGQVDIYGGKSAVEPPRPPIELGRQQYTSGEYDETITIFGNKNPLVPGLAVYGDWRTAVAYNDNAGKDIAQVATRLNIDIDFKITGTERIHAFFTPLQDGTQFTRFEFGGGDGDGLFTEELNADPQTLFFEGDLGSIYSGVSGRYAPFDLPFVVGLYPLFLQNGIWANDAILGGAVTLPARNSPALGLSNYDVTFFGAFDNVDNAGVIGADGKVDNNNTNLFGVTTFIDALKGYIEAGYGLLQGADNQDDRVEHYLTASYTRRYGNTLSNTTRVFWNFGEDNGQDIDGFAIISENSLISGLPSTLIPYANFFVGFDTPRPLVNGFNEGLLKNVGINFETDALTGFPKLDDTASNTWGGAIGLQYLFNLDQQIVVELATVQPFDDPIVGAKDPQYAVGFRYQIPITRAWLIRADATYQFLDNSDDSAGVRFEVRRKF